MLRNVVLSLFVLVASFSGAAAQTCPPPNVTISPADQVVTQTSPGVTFTATGNSSGGYRFVPHFGSGNWTGGGQNIRMYNYTNGTSYAEVTFTNACGQQDKDTAYFVYITPFSSTSDGPYTDFPYTISNTCNAQLTLPNVSLGSVSGRNQDVYWSVDARPFTTNPTAPSTPGLHTIIVERATTKRVGTLPAISSAPDAIETMYAVIFPAAPVLTVNAAANTCNSAFTLPSVTNKSALGFTTQYSIDNGTFSVSPQIPATPGCHSIRAQYVLTSDWGNTNAGATSAGGCGISNTVYITIFPASPTIVAPSNTCNSAFTLPGVTDMSAAGFSPQYSIDGLPFSASPTIPTKVGCHTIQAQYVLTAACGGTPLNTASTASSCGPGNTVSVVIFPATPSIQDATPACMAQFQLPTVTPVSNFTVLYSLDGGRTYSASPSQLQTPGCYIVLAKYALTADCVPNNNAAGTLSPCPSNAVNGLIFPDAPTLATPGNVYVGKPFNLPAVTAVSGFSVQYSVDGVNYSATPTAPTSAGCYNITARYAVSAQCGASAPGAASCVSAAVNEVVFPAAPVLTAPPVVCGGSFSLQAVTAIPGYTVQYSIDNGANYSVSLPAPTTPGCYSITARHVLATPACGSGSNGAVGTPSPVTSVAVNGLIFPSKPVISQPANTCNAAFTLANIASPAGFTIQYKIDNAAYTATPTIPTAPGCHTITAVYVVNSTCGGTSGGTAATCASDPVSVTIFPAAPNITAPTSVCEGTKFTLPTVTDLSTSGFTTQYSVDGGTTFSTNPTILTTAGSYRVSARYVLTSLCTPTAANTTGSAAGAACGASNIVTALVKANVGAPTAPQLSINPVCEGSSFTISVTPTGDGPFTYNWYQGQTHAQTLRGTTTVPTFTVANAALTDAGAYNVTVSGCGPDASSPYVTLTVNPGIRITTQPTAPAGGVCTGSSYTFSVVATGTGTLNYKWYLGGTGNAPLQDGPNASYVIPNVSAANQGQYSVLVTGAGGCGSLLSSSANLIVNPNTSVSVPTGGGLLCPGTAFTTRVTASGPTRADGTYGYQWMKNGTAVTTGTGGTTSNYSISSVAAGDAATYTVQVIGGCGTVVSNGAVLNVSTPVGIKNQPAALTGLCPGSKYLISVTGKGTLPTSGSYTYKWFKGTTLLQSGTDSTYTIANVLPTDAGDYSVTVLGACNTSVVSNTATLSVNSVVTITKEPAANTIACLGGSVSLSVTASGAGPLNYMWTKQNDASFTAANASHITIPGVTAGTAGTYNVQITGACGTPTPVMSTNAVITIGQPAAVTPMADFATDATTSTLTATSNSIPNDPGSFIWTSVSGQGTGATPTSSGTNSSIVVSNNQVGVSVWSVSFTNTCSTSTKNITFVNIPAITTFATTNTCNAALTLPTVTDYTSAGLSNLFSIDNGNYVDGGSYANSPTTSTGCHKIAVKRVLTAQAGNLTAGTGYSSSMTSTSAVVFPAVPKINAPAAVCEGNKFVLPTVTDLSTAGFTTQYSVDGGQTFSTSPQIPMAAGSYTVLAQYVLTSACYTTTPANSTGSCGTSNQVTAIVNQNVAVSSPTASTTLCPGAGFTLTVTASGTVKADGTYGYQWYKGTTAVGTNSSTFSITSVAGGDAGTYTVQVTGGCGTPVTSTGAVLKVNTLVDIATQPTATTALCPGSKYTLSVTPSGTRPFTYSWYKGTAVVATGADSTFTVPSVSASDAGNYSVTVSGACGSTKASNTATLSINSLVTITTQPVASTIACVGGSFPLSVIASGAGTLQYVWTKQGDASFTAANTASITISNVTANTAGTYHVLVTGDCSSQTSTDAVVTIGQPAAITPMADFTTDATTSTLTATSNSVTNDIGSFTWTSISGQGRGATPITNGGNSSVVVSNNQVGVSVWEVTFTNTCGVAVSDITFVNIPAIASFSTTNSCGTALTLPKVTDYSSSGLSNLFSIDGGTYTSSPSVITAPGCHTIAMTRGLTAAAGNLAAGAGYASSMVSTSAVVFPAPPQITAPAAVCEGSSFVLPTVTDQTAAGFTTQYSVDGGNSYSANPNIPTTFGSYVVLAQYVLTSNCGATAAGNTCASSNKVTAVVNQSVGILTPPVANITLCPGAAFTLTVVPSGSGPFTYQWTRGGVVQPITTSTYAITQAAPADSATYVVSVTGSCGTIASNPSVVTVLNPFGNGVIGVNTASVPYGGVVKFTYPQKGLKYNWNFGDGDFPSTSQNPQHPYYTAGSFAVTLSLSSSTSPACTKTVTYSPIVVAMGDSLITGLTPATPMETETLDAFPVPAKDNLTVRSSSAFSSVALIDMRGVAVVSKSYSGLLETSIDVSDLAPGVYILTVTDAHGVKHLKVIKE